MNRLIKFIRLYFNPPKNGDVFFGDVNDFDIERRYERIFYPLIDRNGQTVWNFAKGKHTYRFTIENAAMPYYVCKAEILACHVADPSKKAWLERSFERRIWKKDFHRLVLDGRMVPTKAQSLFG